MSGMDFLVSREPTVDQCEGCGRIEGAYCPMYLMPHAQWTRLGGCAGRTHNLLVKQVEDKRLNPLKASKRTMEVKK